jgi:hypothetical protein
MPKNVGDGMAKMPMAPPVKSSQSTRTSLSPSVKASVAIARKSSSSLRDGSAMRTDTSAETATAASPLIQNDHPSCTTQKTAVKAPSP